jgi:3-hydroxy-D-aspartate aldolase
MTIEELSTPALLLDLDTFNHNVERMAEHLNTAGKRFRPHAKAHKCVEIAKRQISAGAAGVCAATVPEAELMVRSGVTDVLLTSPVADARKCARMAALCSAAADVAVVVDHVDQVRAYAKAASDAGVILNVLIDLDVGDHRTGTAPGAPAVAFAEMIGAIPSLRFGGLQAYSVRASHMTEDGGRSEFSANSLRPASDTKELLASRGILVETVTGGSTGTFECDSSQPHLSELQAGSYALMDAAYLRIGGLPFGNALMVLATVVSANHHDRVTVDAGFKAFSTDRPFGPDVLEVTGARYEWAGDEFGYVFLNGPSRAMRLGDRLRFVPPHCDPTVNLYDRIHVCRGDNVEDVWPVMDRVRL